MTDSTDSFLSGYFTALAIVLVVFLLVSFVQDCHAQKGGGPEPMWTVRVVHDFGGYKVYQNIRKQGDTAWVTTFRFKDWNCEMMYISAVDIEDDGTLVFSGGTEWGVTRGMNGLYIQFESRKLLYKYTEEKPMEMCSGGVTI